MLYTCNSLRSSKYKIHVFPQYTKGDGSPAFAVLLFRVQKTLVIIVFFTIISIFIMHKNVFVIIICSGFIISFTMMHYILSSLEVLSIVPQIRFLYNLRA